MISRRSPTLVRLDRRGGFSADLAEVRDRTIRVEVKQHAHCVSREPGPLLRITPASSRPSPIREGIIKGAATGTPNPIGRNPRPSTARPPAGRTIRPPTPRNPSAVPLARGTRCPTPVAVPTSGHWVPARTAIRYSHKVGRRTRYIWPRGRSQRPGQCCYRGG